MSTQQFDPTRYKAGQQKEWGAAAAGWKDSGQVIELGLQPITDRMMERAEIRPCQKSLLVATGPVQPPLPAPRVVGPSPPVTPLTLTPQLPTTAPATHLR